MIREMYAEIQKQTDKHSVSELCEIYGVSRSGYYKWLKRAGQLNRYEKTHKILDSYVLDIHSHHPMMGYRQIRDKLYLEFGWIVRDNAVMESFWGRFKDTLRKHFRYWECDDLRSTIEQAIYYFNNERPVCKLKGKPPVPYRTELVA